MNDLGPLASRGRIGPVFIRKSIRNQTILYLWPAGAGSGQSPWPAGAGLGQFLIEFLTEIECVGVPRPAGARSG